MQIERWRVWILDICAIAAPTSALYHLTAWAPATCQTPSSGREKAAHLSQLVGTSVLRHSQILAAIVVLVLVAGFACHPSKRLARSAFVAQASIAGTIGAYLAIAYFAVEITGQQVGVRWR